MAEGGGGRAKARFLRCPNCDALLPDLGNFTACRCGACGSTVRGKKPLPFCSLREQIGFGLRKIRYLCRSSLVPVFSP